MGEPEFSFCQRCKRIVPISDIKEVELPTSFLEGIATKKGYLKKKICIDCIKKQNE